MVGEQSNISFVSSAVVRCAVKFKTCLTTLSSLLDSRMFIFIKFPKRTHRNNFDTEAGFLFTSQRPRNSRNAGRNVSFV